MNVLLWHVHGSWTTAFVQGKHRYLLPVEPDRGPDGRGRALTWAWPQSAVELERHDAADADVDVIILQRPQDEELARRWLGRRPGRDVPAIWLEHNAPQGEVQQMQHPAFDRDDLVVVHVTHTNALFWDCGSTPVRVIEHGIVDPGHIYLGEQPRSAVVVNEPIRRGRVAGTDLLPGFAQAAPLDVFGMGADKVAAEPWFDAGRVGLYDDVPQDDLHQEMALRRLYVHPFRWTSLGLSLVEAMHIGMPVVSLATTDAPDSIPPEAGFVSNRLEQLHAGVRQLVAEPELARQMGKAARVFAVERFGLERFLRDWDTVLQEVTT